MRPHLKQLMCHRLPASSKALPSSRIYAYRAAVSIVLVSGCVYARGPLSYLAAAFTCVYVLGFHRRLWICGRRINLRHIGKCCCNVRSGCRYEEYK